MMNGIVRSHSHGSKSERNYMVPASLRQLLKLLLSPVVVIVLTVPTIYMEGTYNHGLTECAVIAVITPYNEWYRSGHKIEGCMCMLLCVYVCV